MENWAFFITSTSRPSTSSRMILTLEAHYDGFDHFRYEEKQKWQVRCDGFYGQNIELGYLRPFYQIKVLHDHPILWNCSPEQYFSVSGISGNILEMMGELFIVHNKVCGNWVNFSKLFGFLPEVLKTNSENQFVVPEPLLKHVAKVFDKYGVGYTLTENQGGVTGLSVMLFTHPGILITIHMDNHT